MFSNINWASDYADVLITTTPLTEASHTGTVEFRVRSESDVQSLDQNLKDLKIRDSEQAPSDGQPESSSSASKNAPDDDDLARSTSNTNQSLQIPEISLQSSFNLKAQVKLLLRGPRGPNANGEEARKDLIQILNIIICKEPNGNTNVVKVGSTNMFFEINTNPEDSEDSGLGNGLQARRGYFYSARPAVNRLLLNVNVTSAAFYPEGSLETVLNKFASNKAITRAIEPFIRLLKITVEYTDQKTGAQVLLHRTISGFHPNKGNTLNTPATARFTFKNVHGRESEITVQQYFWNEKHIRVRTDLKVIACGSGSKTELFPMEFCTVKPGQAYHRSLDADQTTAMLEFAARAPKENAESIASDGLQLIGVPNSSNAGANSSLAPFGFDVGPQMITVPGRILPPPPIRIKKELIHLFDGSWYLNGHFHEARRFSRMKPLVIYNDKTVSIRDPKAIVDQLKQTLSDTGVKPGVTTDLDSLDLTRQAVIKQSGPILQTSNASGSQKAINFAKDELIRQKFEEAKNSEVDVIFIILPDADRWLYSRIKYHGDVKFGIHTICAIGSKIEKKAGRAAFLNNLALKFNIKAGGQNHTILGLMSEAPLTTGTMVMGIDVTHPSPGSHEQAPSIAAVVANDDKFLFSWPGSIRIQKGRDEIVTDIEQMVVERLTRWKSNNKERPLPDQIVLYRDGVSEGQYKDILAKELSGFQKAFQRFYKAEKDYPKMTVIVVGKRHHTRFYPTRKDHTDWGTTKKTGAAGSTTGNAKPGTVVDRNISDGFRREFWLQPHKALKGTARSAHYVVLKDQIGFTGNQLEQFTHSLCYLFNRATKAVSICPPVYYADRLCERGRNYLFDTYTRGDSDPATAAFDLAAWDGTINDKMENKTFYI